MDINLPISPPINNNIQTSLIDKIEAITFDKIRVVNSQLDSRLSLQERTINKHRQDVERTHVLQTQRLRREFKKIRAKKPDYVFDDSDISTSKSRITSESNRPRSLCDTNKLSYCRRYYSHHFNVKDPTKVDKKDKNGKKDECNDFFNMKLRLFYVNMMNKADHYSTHLEHDESQVFESRAGRDLKEDELNESYGTDRSGRFFTQTSVDYESDDVFELSNGSYKAPCEPYSNKLECINDNEDVNGEIIDDDIMNNNIEHEKDEAIMDKPVERTTQKIEIRRHSEFPRDGRGPANRRMRRRNTDGAKMNFDPATIEANRKKNKNAFEKIFAGLL